ncbi:YodC family protein [Paracidovorax oryzae]|uniref:YodC family protein n=1 Tax=Paracidovorax oryzae TaxID=862720 RepID=UPI0035D0B533
MGNFRKGDVVILKSGGPEMTVIDIADYSPQYSETAAKCQWFDGKTFQDAVFDQEVLKPAPKPFVGLD